MDMGWIWNQDAVLLAELSSLHIIKQLGIRIKLFIGTRTHQNSFHTSGQPLVKAELDSKRPKTTQIFGKN